MAEDSQQSSKRANHTWTAEEDKVLVECLIDIGSIYKGENGFKPGFSGAIKKLMHQRILGCTLREVERQIFDDWVKSHPNGKGLFNKPFPHYDQLGVVFGKDVASGQGAEGPTDTIHEMQRDGAMNAGSGIAFNDYLDMTGDYIPTPCGDTTMPDIPQEEVMPPSPVSTATTTRGKKRQRSEDPLLVEVVDVMKDLSHNYKKSNDSIDKLTSCFQHQADGSHRRMSIVTELEKFEELTMGQQVHLAVQLGRDSNLTDVFMQCSHEKRVVLVAGLLANYQ
ncbi:uncharacterized protein LOC133308301 [Gastrolobium bilobum]|uniref:uncharacterized protein LOC133308301 n=1 Tax=Gastrolobium bilobum TaxID=150636 RepID=UPI002AAF6BB6|nr:uncharacterized protein LOC133308301 [Gastrolobium bilobum]